MDGRESQKDRLYLSQLGQIIMNKESKFQSRNSIYIGDLNYTPQCVSLKRVLGSFGRYGLPMYV